MMINYDYDDDGKPKQEMFQVIAYHMIYGIVVGFYLQGIIVISKHIKHFNNISTTPSFDRPNALATAAALQGP